MTWTTAQARGQWVHPSSEGEGDAASKGAGWMRLHSGAAAKQGSASARDHGIIPPAEADGL